MFQVVKKNGRFFGFLTGKSEMEILKKCSHYGVAAYKRPFMSKMMDGVFR
jgi:hypothetical protein